MAKIHMETENVRTLARLLDQKADEIEDSVERLKRARSRLAGAWSGGSREKRFMNQYKAVISGLDARANELQALSLRVYREVDEWVEKDEEFGVNKKWLSGFGGFLSGASDIADGVYDGMDLGAKLIIGASMAAGSAYKGELIIPGGKGLKEFAGMKGKLNHVRADHLGKVSSLKPHFGPLQIGLAGLEFGGRAVNDWAEYDKGTEIATAIAADLAFVATKTVATHYIGYAAMLGATALLTTFGAPVVAVGIVGLGVWWLGSYVSGKVIDNVYDSNKDAIVIGGSNLLENIGSGAAKLGKSIAASSKSIVQSIDNLFKSPINNVAIQSA